MKLGIYIDLPNFWGSQLQAGYKIDWNKIRDITKFLPLVDETEDTVEVVELKVFKTRQENNEGFMRMLSHIGATVHEENSKNDIDAQMINHLLNISTSPNLDAVIIVSGDSDFEPAINVLKQQGKEVYILTAAACLSHHITKAADDVLLLEDEKIRRTLFFAPFDDPTTITHHGYSITLDKEITIKDREQNIVAKITVA